MFDQLTKTKKNPRNTENAMVIAAKNVWELPGKLSGGTIICPSASAKTRRQPLPLLIRLDVVSLISSPFKKNRLPANFIRTRTSQAAIVRRTIIRFKLAKTRQHGANANANPGFSTYCDMENRKKKIPHKSVVSCKLRRHAVMKYSVHTSTRGRVLSYANDFIYGR